MDQLLVLKKNISLYLMVAYKKDELKTIGITMPRHGKTWRERNSLVFPLLIFISVRERRGYKSKELLLNTVVFLKSLSTLPIISEKSPIVINCLYLRSIIVCLRYSAKCMVRGMRASLENAVYVNTPLVSIWDIMCYCNCPPVLSRNSVSLKRLLLLVLICFSISSHIIVIPDKNRKY